MKLLTLSGRCWAALLLLSSLSKALEPCSLIGSPYHLFKILPPYPFPPPKWSISISVILEILFSISAKSPFSIALAAWGLTLYLCDLHSCCSLPCPSAPAIMVSLAFLVLDKLTLTSRVLRVMLSMLGLFFTENLNGLFSHFLQVSLLKCYRIGGAFPDPTPAPM